jgi:hypothetical protein
LYRIKVHFNEKIWINDTESYFNKFLNGYNDLFEMLNILYLELWNMEQYDITYTSLDKNIFSIESSNVIVNINWNIIESIIYNWENKPIYKSTIDLKKAIQSFK